MTELVLLWQRRAAHARRIATTLAPNDAAILEDYAAECEGRARCLASSFAADHWECNRCPFGCERCRVAA